jgi:hypothetical protein
MTTSRYVRLFVLLLAFIALDAALVSADSPGSLSVQQQSFILAQRANDYDRIIQLLKEGMDPDGEIPALQMTPLALAVLKKDVRLIEILADAGADLNREDHVSTAILTGQPEIAEALVQAGAGVTDQAKAYAALKGSGGDTSMQWLLGSGSDVGENADQGGRPKIEHVDIDTLESGARVSTGLYTGPCSGDLKDAWQPKPKPGQTGSVSATTTVFRTGLIDIAPAMTESDKGLMGVAGAMVTGIPDKFTVSKVSGCKPIELGVGEYTVVTYSMQDKWEWKCDEDLGANCLILYKDRQEGFPTVSRTVKYITVAADKLKDVEKPDKDKPRIVILEPLNKATNNNEFVFDESGRGKFVFEAIAEVTPAKYAGRVKWELDGVDFAKVRMTPLKGSKVEITVRGLPVQNSDFGEKTLKASIPGAHDTAQMRLFFPPAETNHPGEGKGETPNWHYYWRQGAVPHLDRFEYDPKLCKETKTVYGVADTQTGKLYICEKGADTYVGYRLRLRDKVEYTDILTGKTPPPVIRCSGKGGVHEIFFPKGTRGIETAARIVVHELKHLEVFNAAGRGVNDRDEDLLGASVDENGSLAFEYRKQSGICLSPVSPDTHRLSSQVAVGFDEQQGYFDKGDYELLSILAENDAAHKEALDWSECGKQWSNRSGCPGE